MPGSIPGARAGSVFPTKCRQSEDLGVVGEGPGVVWGWSGGRFWVIFGPSWDHFGMVWGWSGGRFWVIFGSSWDHFGITLASFWHQCGIVLGRFGVGFGMEFWSKKTKIKSRNDLGTGSECVSGFK